MLVTTVAYLIVGLVLARISAVYFTEKFTLEEKYPRFHNKKRKITFEEWKAQEITRYGRTQYSDTDLIPQYKQYLSDYPSSSTITERIASYKWEYHVPTMSGILLLPLLWLPALVLFLPFKYGITYGGKLGKAALNQIDWVGKELANPRNNIRRDK